MFRILLLLAALGAIVYWVLPTLGHKPSAVEQTIEQQVADLNREVDTLQKKSQAAGARTRKEVDHQVAALRHQIQQSEKRLSDLRASGQSRWASVRQLWGRWFGSKKPE